MNLSFEFTLTSADLRQLMALSGARRFSLMRILAAVVLLAMGAHHWFNRGLDWIVVLHIAMAVYFIFSDSIFLWLFVRFMQLWSKQAWVTQLSINQESFEIEQSGYRREIPWLSFAMTGTAKEIENHFMLECGRGTVWIPKRAFATADDMATFRALVEEKMGKRCQFIESPAPLG